MAYEKQAWATGDTITAEKLNHMEDGIAAGGGRLLVKFTFDVENETYICNKTFAEVYAAVQAEKYVYAHEDANENYLTLAIAQGGEGGDLLGVVRFEYTSITPSGVSTFAISLKSDNTITYGYDSYPSSPSPAF